MYIAVPGHATARDRLGINARRILGPMRKYAGFLLDDGRFITAIIEGRIDLPGYGWVDESTFTLPRTTYWLRTPITIKGLTGVKFQFSGAVVKIMDERQGHTISVSDCVDVEVWSLTICIRRPSDRPMMVPVSQIKVA